MPSARAPAQSVVHVVRGVVYDSVAHAALPSAIVQAVQLDSASRVTAHVYWGVTDARGHFTIAGLPSGRFAFGFQHDALNALQLESPLRVVELAAQRDVTVDLAIPPGTVVRAQSCAARQGKPGDGMLAGYVLNAASGAPLDSATIELHWTEFERSAGNYQTVPHRVIATMSDDGKFVACGVASKTPIGVIVARKGYRDVKGELTIPDSGAMRRDFHLVGSRVERGTATLVGRVVRADSTPLSAGHLLVPELGVDVPVENGSFTVSGLPPGTWTVEARAIGYEPQRAIVDVAAQTATSSIIVVSNRVQLLEGVSVMATVGSDYKKLVEILERKRIGFGTFFMPGDERLARARDLTDLVQLATGFHANRKGVLEGRVIGGLRGLDRCHPTVFVDGVRGELMVPMSDVLAVAAYPDVAGTPVNLRDGRTCAVIMVWTKR